MTITTICIDLKNVKLPSRKETNHVYTDLSEIDNTVFVTNENHLDLMKISFLFSENRAMMKNIVEKYAKEKYRV